MSAPQIVLFDADGVIQQTTPGWRETLAGFTGSDDASVHDSFIAEVFAAEIPAMTGAESFPEALAGVLDRWGIDAAVDDVFKPWTMIDVNPESLTVVRTLRAAGTRCYLATNQTAARAAVMRELGYDDVFDGQFYSCELGLAKPDPAYFTAILERLDSDGSEVLFVDDLADNVAGAVTAGLRAEVYTLREGPAALHALLTRHGLTP